MILVGNQRGGARDLAKHLQKEENERVELDELRGFASDNLDDALLESHAISRVTKCKQHLFSLSINPPKNEEVSKEDFRKAILKAEERLRLNDQPRAIVFHEKYGDDGELRRHAHAVWCRIDTENLKAVQLSFSKQKMQEVSKELYIEHNWTMPKGHLNKELTDKRNFTLSEWQQAKRAGKDPKQQKTMFQDTWATSDSKEAFANALKEQGYVLAKGDRRGFVAVDHEGEVYSVSRWVGIKAKQVRERMGNDEGLPSVNKAHGQAGMMVAERLKQIRIEEARQVKQRQEKLNVERERKQEQHRRDQEQIAKDQAARETREAQERLDRLRTGLWGLLDRVTGLRKRTLELNAQEEIRAKKRDQKERQATEEKQKYVQENLQRKVDMDREQYIKTQQELRHDVRSIEQNFNDRSIQSEEDYIKEQQQHSKQQSLDRNHDDPSLDR
ncbi:MAG: hypothetical protein DHS20C07_17060 [Methyloligella sp.]|nr:MAG: hypothetical protein DHS20C07_17060 [Methyloligella sp.]